MPDPFHVRFNIEVPIEEVRRRFINRIETKIRDAVEAAHADWFQQVSLGLCFDGNPNRVRGTTP
jgi:hypothetical protein